MKNISLTAVIAIGAVIFVIGAIIYRQDQPGGSPLNQNLGTVTQTTPGSSESIGVTGDAQVDQESQAADQQLNDLDNQIDSLDQNLGP
jgi:hypothetical protein